MNAKPIGPWILLKVVTEEKEQTGKLIKRKTEENYSKAKVIKLGTGVVLANGERTTFNVEEGDTVLFKHFSGMNIELEGESYVMCYESDILIVLN